MVRGRKETEAGKEASRKWRETMMRKHGGANGLRAHMSRMGRKGGMNSRTGGFATNPELARICGAKGGKKSKRGPFSITKTVLEPNSEKNVDLYSNGYSIPQIAQELGVPSGSVRRWAKDNIEEYSQEFMEKTE